MKKKIILSVLALASITVAGCVFNQFRTTAEKQQKQQEKQIAFEKLNKKDSINILFQGKLVNYNIKEGKFKKQGEVAVPVEGTNSDFVEFGNELMFSLGYAKSEDSEYKVAKINMDTGNYQDFAREPLPTTGGITAFKHFYTMSSSDKTTIQQFDTNGELLNENSFKNESVGSAIYETDDKVFMMVGAKVNDDYMSYQGKVVVYDAKNLKYLHTYQFDNPNDTDFMRYSDVEVFNDTLYLPYPTKANKMDTSIKTTSYDILTYDLKNKKIGSIQTTEPYPAMIELDKSKENFIIFHDHDTNRRPVFSIYNLKSKKITDILYVNELLGEDSVPNTGWTVNTTKDGKFIFSNGKKVVLYDLKKKKVLDIITLTDEERDTVLHIFCH